MGIETSIDVITDEKINDYVNNVNHIKYVMNVKDIIDVIDIVIDFLISDDVNAGINDVNIITNANNNYFYWVNHIKYVMNVKDIIDPIEIIITCISDNIYIIDAIYSLDIIETSIDVNI